MFALVILYKNIGLLTVITTDDYKLKPVKQTTIVNIGLIILCGLGIILMEMGVVSISEENEKYVAAFISLQE